MFVLGYDSSIELKSRSVKKKFYDLNSEELNYTKYTFNYSGEEFVVVKNMYEQPMFKQFLDQIIGFLLFELRWSFDDSMYHFEDKKLGFDLINNIDHFSIKEVRDFILDNIDEDRSNMDNVKKLKKDVKYFEAIENSSKDHIKQAMYLQFMGIISESMNKLYIEDSDKHDSIFDVDVYVDIEKLFEFLLENDYLLENNYLV